jgi:hypothetical protein
MGRLARIQAIRASERTGRPRDDADFIADLERILECPIARRAPGRKPNPGGESDIAVRVNRRVLDNLSPYSRRQTCRSCGSRLRFRLTTRAE